MTLVFNGEQLSTILRLIDYRIMGLRQTNCLAKEVDPKAINEAVELTKFRMLIQNRLNAGC